MQLREVAPPREHLDTLLGAFDDAHDRRAVLDLPIGRMARSPVALLDAAYHGHPTSACYNSLIPATMRAVYAQAARAHLPHGVEELAAAGFGYVIERAREVSPTSFSSPARLIAIGPDAAVWGLPHPGALHHDITQLEFTVAQGATRGVTFAPAPPHEIDVEVTNRGAQIWAAPRPVSPSFADVELARADGSVALRTRARGVLPLALAPGATTTMQLTIPEAPEPGVYHATLTLEGVARPIVAPGFEWMAREPI
jgi:hypothetical protein